MRETEHALEGLGTVRVTTPEVAAFLTDSRWRYLTVLRDLKERLTRYALSEEGRSVVYSVYSRGNTQQGSSEFKDAWQIKWKVNLQREHSHPDFAIQDVEDIIGITVVSNFRGQTELVERFLQVQAESGFLEILDAKDKDEETGYKARHLVVALQDPRYTGVRCEIQLKSVLHDAWTRWSHDLTYKPKGFLPAEVHEQMNSVSELLTTTDKLTASFKKQIDKGWEHQRELREAAMNRLTRLVGDALEAVDEHRQEYQAIIDEFIDESKKYLGGEASELIPRIKKVAGDSHDLATCWNLTHLASLRERDDLDYLALDRIERCISACRKPNEWLGAYSIKAFALLIFNEVAGAVEAADLALDVAERKGDRGEIVTAESNVASLLAELGDPRRGDRARALIDDVVSSRGGEENLLPEELDTLGHVKIVFGKTVEEVEVGMALCREAAEKDEDDIQGTLFLRLRELIADAKRAELADAQLADA